MQVITVSDERRDITIDITNIKSYFNIKWMLETNLWPKNLRSKWANLLKDKQPKFNQEQRLSQLSLHLLKKLNSWFKTSLQSKFQVQMTSLANSTKFYTYYLRITQNSTKMLLETKETGTFPTHFIRSALP